MVDMGVDGVRPMQPSRSTLGKLYGRDVLVDSRKIVAFMRGVSLLSEEEYQNLRAPYLVQKFPGDIFNQPDLEYTGLYEDGWIADNAEFTLMALPGAILVVEGGIPSGLRQTIEVSVDGVQVASQALSEGGFSIRVPAAEGKHRLKLRFTDTMHLPGDDQRPAAAVLSYVGFHVPTD
jgi:hypothetical protein